MLMGSVDIPCPKALTSVNNKETAPLSIEAMLRRERDDDREGLDWDAAAQKDWIGTQRHRPWRMERVFLLFPFDPVAQDRSTEDAI
jgi:hypothetical protein